MRYFRKSYHDWEASLLRRADVFLSLRVLLREAYELNRGNPERSGPEIPRMIDFLEFLQTAIHEAYGRWSAQRSEADDTQDKE